MGATTKAKVATVQEIPVAQIVAGQNDRTKFDQAKLNELADSIALYGLAQPITVRPVWLFPCGHSVSVKVKELTLWNALFDRASKSSATPQGCSTEKAASGSNISADDTIARSRRANRTKAKPSVDGSNESGESGGSISSESNGEGETITTSGTGRSMPAASSSSFLERSCPICGSSGLVQSEHLPQPQSSQKHDARGRGARTPSCESIGQASGLKISPQHSDEAKQGSDTEQDGSDCRTSGREDCELVRAGVRVVAGERRYRAIAHVLKRETAPCIVRADLDDEAESAVMLVENVSRVNLDPLAEARAYEKRIDAHGWTPEQVAIAAGTSTETVKKRLSLLLLFEDAQKLVSAGSLPLGHAEAIAQLDRNRQVIALRIFREGKGLSLGAFRQIVGQLMSEQSQDGLFNLEAFWVQRVAEEADAPQRGKQAAVNVPTRDDLPQPTLVATEGAAAIMERYIRELDAAGHTAEAAAIGTLYSALVRGNYLRVPNVSEKKA
jgi:ParB/RepB/Spo0J family partition protein